MLKFKATQLFDGERLLDDKVLITQSDGTIESIVAASDAGESVRELRGILMPGLINCHCHLELSHLKDVIAPHTGLIEFLCSVVTKRNFPAELIQERITAAEQEMYRNGIVAVGDIGNTADTDHNQISRKPFRIGMQQKFTLGRCNRAYLSVEMQHHSMTAMQRRHAMADGGGYAARHQPFPSLQDMN